jgi:hypothetical protein
MRLPLATIGLLLRTILATHGNRASIMEIRTAALSTVVPMSELFGESLCKQR